MRGNVERNSEREGAPWEERKSACLLRGIFAQDMSARPRYEPLGCEELESDSENTCGEPVSARCLACRKKLCGYCKVPSPLHAFRKPSHVQGPLGLLSDVSARRSTCMRKDAAERPARLSKSGLDLEVGPQNDRGAL